MITEGRWSTCFRGAARLRRRLEDNHWLAAITLLALMSILMAAKCYSVASRTQWSIDNYEVALAARFLDAYNKKAMPLAENQKPEKALALVQGPAIAPGYGIVLLAFAIADPHVAVAIECLSMRSPCPSTASFASVHIVQFILAAISLVLVFVLALRLSGTMEVALVTLVLTFMGTHVGSFAGQILPGLWPPVLTILAMVLTYEAGSRGNPVIAMAAGFTAGIGVLFTPLAVIGIPAVAILLPLVSQRQNHKACRGIAGAAGYVLGFSAAGLPLWLAMQVSYEVEWAFRLVAQHLAERAAFQSMDVLSWTASLFLPIPFLSGPIKLIFPETTIDQLGSYRLGTYVMYGATEIYPRAQAASHSAFGQMIWLLKHYVLDWPISYLAVTPAILNRGIWAGGNIIGLLGLLHLKRMFVLHRQDGRLSPLLLVAVPSVLLLGANTFLTANAYWFNAGLVYLYAYATASVVANFPPSAKRRGGLDASRARCGNR